MKHLLKKINIAGAGKKSKPQVKPAVLTPPDIGQWQISASYSYAETLDIISDGPIAGLVNKNGLLLNKDAILQGIYLDNTPIAVSNDDAAEASSQDSIGANLQSLATIRSDQTATKVGSLFVNLSNNTTPGGIHPLSALDSSYKKIAGWDQGEQYEEGRWYNWASSLNYQGPFYREIAVSDKTNVNSAKYHDHLKRTSDSLLFYNLNTLSNWYYYNPPVNASSKGSWQTSIEDNYTEYFNEYIKPSFTQIRNLYNSGNVYQKDLIDKIFKRNIGNDWINYTDLPNHWFINKCGLAKLNDSMLVFLKAPSTTTAINVDLKSTAVNSTKFVEFVFEDSLNKRIKTNNGEITYYDFFVPIVNASGFFTGEIQGFYLILIKGAEGRAHAPGGLHAQNPFNTNFSIKTSSINTLKNISTLKLKYLDASVTAAADYEQKYNYSNVLAEVRYGKEYQEPFRFFNKVLIDKVYQSSLIGPFKLFNQIQKVPDNNSLLVYQNNFGIPTAEGSLDNRDGKSFTDWSTLDNNYNEIANPITHIIENPNVTSVYVSFQVDNLFDTLQKQKLNFYGTDKHLNAGSKYPAILNVQIETGLTDESGQNKSQISTYRFQIVALVESPSIIDIGNPELTPYVSNDYKFIQAYDGKQINQPFILPSIESSSNSAYDLSIKRRYVKVTKLSTETNSTLVQKNVKLNKITEIIDVNLTYPFSAIIGTKIDSRSFSAIPNRIYDCKLKKVKVPSNYHPIYVNGKDKRYFNTKSEYDTTDLEFKQIYIGDWDGTFKEDLEWTDNPAWILYDILTSTRYGLGQYLDVSQIDIWELYKVARFCDTVDDNGYFIGVPDGAGGLEPRFSCNILFQEESKIFDTINTIAALFRGIVYYYNSEINFVDDRPRLASSLFTNANVKDGLFSYSNYRRDEQYNSIEVVYIDRFNDFETRIEYVEDEEDIAIRGIFKRTINAAGVSSRAMARRIGQHLIYQTIKENESVSFSTGTEALLCRPGDLIIVEDELRSLKSNFGKILDVDTSRGSIRLNESFSSEDFDNKLTVYTPTGDLSINDLNFVSTNRAVTQSDLNQIHPPQITTFGVTGIEIKDYGCEAYISKNDINYSLLNFVSPGSTYRFQRKNADDQLYKVLKIIEDYPNEYTIIANKYSTGKWSLIENNISIEVPSNTYSYLVTQTINNKTLETLSPPQIKYFSTGFDVDGQLIVSGRWTKDIKATGYNVKLVYPNGNYSEINTSSTGFFDYVGAVGNYSLRVNAKGNSSNAGSNQYVYYDSQYDSSGIFIMFDGSTSVNYDRSFVKSIKIL